MVSPLVRPMVSAGSQRKNRLDSVNDDENFNPRHRTRRYHFYSKCVDDKLASPIGTLGKKGRVCLETGVSRVESGGDCFCRFLWEGMSLRKGVEMVDDRGERF